jgi:hypothetical protein
MGMGLLELLLRGRNSEGRGRRGRRRLMRFWGLVSDLFILTGRGEVCEVYGVDDRMMTVFFLPV